MKEEKIVKIIFDVKQYSVRIPMKFVKRLCIDTKKDTIIFRMTTMDFEGKTKPTLTAELVRGKIK